MGFYFFVGGNKWIIQPKHSFWISVLRILHICFHASVHMSIAQPHSGLRENVWNFRQTKSLEVKVRTKCSLHEWSTRSRYLHIDVNSIPVGLALARDIADSKRTLLLHSLLCVGAIDIWNVMEMYCSDRHTNTHNTHYYTWWFMVKLRRDTHLIDATMK